VAEAGDVAATTACLHEHAPDVLILDVHLGAENGLDAMASLLDASPATGVLVLRMQGDPAFARKALHAGALERANARLARSVLRLEAFAQIAREVGGETCSGCSS